MRKIFIIFQVALSWKTSYNIKIYSKKIKIKKIKNFYKVISLKDWESPLDQVGL